MENKKAFASSIIAKVIIILITAGIIILFFGHFANLFGEQVNEKTCAASVAARGASGISGELAKLKIPLRCKTDYLCLSMGGKCIEGYTKIDVKTEDDIKKQIADSMYSCWKTFGAGEINFFGGGEGCAICSVVDFDDKLQQKYPNINGFMNYLAVTPVPGANYTYTEYLTKAQKDKIIQTSESTIQDVIPTNTPYSIAFMFAKVDKWKEITPALQHMGIGTTIGVIAFFLPPPADLIAGPLLVANGGIGIVRVLGTWIIDMATLKECYLTPCSSLFFGPYTMVGSVCKDIKSIP